METPNNTSILLEYLDKNSIEYTIDNNPSPDKVSRITAALDRKKNLMNLAVATYKQVFRG